MKTYTCPLYISSCTWLLFSITAQAEHAPLPEGETAFEAMLSEVYQRHPQLESQREELRILDERVSQANAGFRPSLTANAGYGKQRVKVASGQWQYGDDRSRSLQFKRSEFKNWLIYFSSFLLIKAYLTTIINI